MRFEPVIFRSKHQVVTFNIDSRRADLIQRDLYETVARTPSEEPRSNV